jgi:hypothetical protein
VNAPAPIAPAQGPISPAPIAVRTASLGPEFFETDTGRRFEPRGFNYFTSAAHQPPALLYPPVAPSSDPSAQTSVTFLPGFYDPDAATAALGRMRQSRYNTVRLYLNAATAPLDSVPPGERLSPGYMANAADFIARARQSALRVILVFGYLPRAYDDIVEAPCARIPPDPDYETMQIDLGGQTFDICGLKGVGGLNALYMHRGIIEATGRFIVDSLDAIAAIDPTLLDSILGVDVSNEPFVWPGEAPFSLSEGSIALDLDGPKTYDLAALTGPASRQELAARRIPIRSFPSPSSRPTTPGARATTASRCSKTPSIRASRCARACWPKPASTIWTFTPFPCPSGSRPTIWKRRWRRRRSAWAASTCRSSWARPARPRVIISTSMSSSPTCART